MLSRIENPEALADMPPGIYGVADFGVELTADGDLKLRLLIDPDQWVIDYKPVVEAGG